jgi:hypothetical protein
VTMAPPGSSRPSLTYTDQTLEALLPAITPCLNFSNGWKAVICSSLSELTPVRQKRTFVDFGPNTLVLGAGPLGRKRGIFVLAADAIAEEDSDQPCSTDVGGEAPGARYGYKEHDGIGEHDGTSSVITPSR